MNPTLQIALWSLLAVVSAARVTYLVYKAPENSCGGFVPLFVCLWSVILLTRAICLN